LRFIIYGAGAVGSIIGGHMFRKNQNVILIARSNHVNEINKNGLRLITPGKEYNLKVPAYSSISEIPNYTDEDVIFLTTKSQHVLPSLGKMVNAGISKKSPIFCFQNGISTEPLTSRIFYNVYGAVLSMAGIFLEPGVVYDNVDEGKCFIEIGLYPYGIDRVSGQVNEALQASGFAGGLNEYVMTAKASKCLIGLGHALLAITDGKGDLTSFVEKLREEAKRVWSCSGIDWEDLDKFSSRVNSERGGIIRHERFIDKSTIVSSWQSLEKSKGNIEAREINGDIVNLGRMLNIETPYNELICKVAEKMAEKGEKPGKYSVDELSKMIKG
jgi:2-dehydropantoate 2-reductase